MIYASTLGLDRDGSDQHFSGTNWSLVEASRILWDKNNDYDMDSNEFIVPKDGIYLLDFGIKFKSFVGLTKIELGIFKGEDLWFICKEMNSFPSSTAILSGTISFDMYEGERFALQVKLTGLIPSTSIEGDDDYTAWSYNYVHEI